MSIEITFQQTRQTTTAAGQIGLGTVGVLPDGREFVYVKANSALAAGSVAVPVAQTAVDECSSSTDSQGRIVYITKASAGWTAGAFAEGWVVVDDGTGVGQAGKILTNTSDTLQLYPEFAFSTALSATDSDITINQPYLVEKSAITDKAQQAKGVAQIAFAAADYGWIQKFGPGIVLAGEVLTKDLSFVTGDDTTGQVLKGTTAKGAFDEQALGYCVTANAGADQKTMVFFTIDA